VLAGCRRRRLGRFQEGEEEARALVERVREHSVPFALQARFAIKVQGPDFSGTTSGAMILLDPDKLRIEVNGPVGTPLFILASDGKALHCWSQRDATFFRGDDGVAVLRELTGGTVATTDLISLLTGTLPLDGAPIVDLGADPDGAVRVVFQAAEGLRVRAAVDPQHELLRRVSLLQMGDDDDGTEVLRVAYNDLMRVGNNRMPEEIDIEAPTIGWRAALEIHTWDELGRIPDAFALTPPSNAQEKDLVTTLKEMAKQPTAVLPTPPSQP